VSVLVQPLTDQQIAERLIQAFPDAGLEWAPGQVPATRVPVDSLHAVCERLRDDPSLRFDYPASWTAVDYLDYFELICQLRSFLHHHDVTLKVRIDRDDPVVPSVYDLWPGVDFQEREIYDLMGIRFAGHPNLTRILLWDEFVGHPLRKDYGIPAALPSEVELALQHGELLNLPPNPGPRALDERGGQ
jgi:NADH-quinone oxidoreductase subunit C